MAKPENVKSIVIAEALAGFVRYTWASAHRPQPRFLTNQPWPGQHVPVSAQILICITQTSVVEYRNSSLIGYVQSWLVLLPSTALVVLCPVAAPTTPEWIILNRGQFLKKLTPSSTASKMSGNAESTIWLAVTAYFFISVAANSCDVRASWALKRT